MSRKTVCVILGGKSTEHEESVESAFNLMAHYVDRSKYDVHAVYIDRDGRFLTPSEFRAKIPFFLESPLITVFKKDPDPGKAFGDFIDGVSRCPGSKEDRVDFFGNALGGKYDYVFPIMLGKNGEDGSVQGMLEFLNVPYIGAGLQGASLAIDKIAAKELCRAAGLRVVDWVGFTTGEWREGRESILRRIGSELTYPLFVKPAMLGSSIGMTKAKTPSELEEGIDLAFRYDGKVLVESGITGTEYAVAVMGYGEAVASVPAEFRFSGEYFDFNAKCGSDAPFSVVPAPLPKSLSEELVEFAKAVYRTLEIGGFARVDCFIERGVIYLNEVNTTPVMHIGSTFIRQWEASGVTPPGFFEHIVEYADRRAAARAELKYAR